MSRLPLRPFRSLAASFIAVTAAIATTAAITAIATLAAGRGVGGQTPPAQAPSERAASEQAPLVVIAIFDGLRPDIVSPSTRRTSRG